MFRVKIPGAGPVIDKLTVLLGAPFDVTVTGIVNPTFVKFKGIRKLIWVGDTKKIGA